MQVSKISNEQNPDRPVKISLTLLLSVYTVIPISIVFILIDLIFLSGELKARLPSSPELLFPFLIFFRLPHVIGSSLSFADTEYIKYYSSELILPLSLIIVSVILLPQLIGFTGFILILELWTIKHSLGQQFGLAKMFNKFSGKSFFIWYWLGILAGEIIYFSTLIPQSIVYIPSQVARTGAFAYLAAYLIISTILYQQTTYKFGRAYFLSNVVFVLTMGVVAWIDYPFIFALIPRITHDITAFIFYSSHDHNRSISKNNNIIFNLFKNLRLPVLLLSPLMAIIIALPITAYLHFYPSNNSVILRISFILVLFHYYTDGLVWQNGTPHREQISFS